MELWSVAQKIKMTQNRTVTEYVNKNRVLRDDMIIEAWKEVPVHNERATVRLIIERLEGTEALTKRKMSGNIVSLSNYQNIIDDIEILMVEYARDTRQENEARKGSMSG